MDNGGFNPNQGQMNNPQMNNNFNNMNNNMYNQQPASNNKKPLIIVGIAVAVVVIAVVFILVLGKKDEDKTVNSYDDYLKQQEKEEKEQKEKEQKEEAELNKNQTIKDYVLNDGSILIEFNNNNNIVVDGEFKVDFYDENGTLIDTKDTVVRGVRAKTKNYALLNIYSDKKEYDKYKINTKVKKSYISKIYNDKIEIISQNKVDGSLVGQIKNNHTEKIDHIELLGIYYDSNNKIIAVSEESLFDVDAGETTSFKMYIPTGDDYKTINYNKVEIIVRIAYDLQLLRHRNMSFFLYKF